MSPRPDRERDTRDATRCAPRRPLSMTTRRRPPRPCHAGDLACRPGSRCEAGVRPSPCAQGQGARVALSRYGRAPLSEGPPRPRFPPPPLLRVPGRWSPSRPLMCLPPGQLSAESLCNLISGGTIESGCADRRSPRPHESRKPPGHGDLLASKAASVQSRWRGARLDWICLRGRDAPVRGWGPAARSGGTCVQGGRAWQSGFVLGRPRRPRRALDRQRLCPAPGRRWEPGAQPQWASPPAPTPPVCFGGPSPKSQPQVCGGGHHALRHELKLKSKPQHAPTGSWLVPRSSAGRGRGSTGSHMCVCVCAHVRTRAVGRAAQSRGSGAGSAPREPHAEVPQGPHHPPRHPRPPETVRLHPRQRRAACAAPSPPDARLGHTGRGSGKNLGMRPGPAQPRPLCLKACGTHRDAWQPVPRAAGPLPSEGGPSELSRSPSRPPGSKPAGQGGLTAAPAEPAPVPCPGLLLLGPFHVSPGPGRCRGAAAPHPLPAPPALSLHATVRRQGPAMGGQTAHPVPNSNRGHFRHTPGSRASACRPGPAAGGERAPLCAIRGAGPVASVSSVCPSSVRFGSAGLPGLGRQRAPPAGPGEGWDLLRSPWSHTDTVSPP